MPWGSEHFTESYHGVICHDCWSAQNKTPAGAHQLCHAHLLRNLQYAVDAERSAWAYQTQRLLRKSQRAREKIWQDAVSPERRAAVIRYYQEALDALPPRAFDPPRGAQVANASAQAQKLDLSL